MLKRSKSWKNHSNSFVSVTKGNAIINKAQEVNLDFRILYEAVI